MDPRRANQKYSDPATCILQPVAVCEDAVVLDRLVVPAAESMSLLLPILVVIIPVRLCATVLMRWSLEADPDERPRSLWPVESCADGGLSLE